MAKHKTTHSRRKFLGGLGAVTVALAARRDAAGTAKIEREWNHGDLVHLLPLVNHERMLIKASFQAPHSKPPRLRVGKESVLGIQSDTQGRFWQFDVDGLASDRPYDLQIMDAGGAANCDPWPLKTFPAPRSSPERLRILAYTCAGGSEFMVLPGGDPLYLPMTARKRLFQRGLSLAPDVVIANGDHIYWDQRLAQMAPQAMREMYQKILDTHGRFDRGLPALGTQNEAVLKNIADEQIANLYGVSFRSVPVFMVTDDHDLFDNDGAIALSDYNARFFRQGPKENHPALDAIVPFPPDRFMLDAGRAVQRLYYPEFLPDPTRPSWLPGSPGPLDRRQLSETFGTLRYGKLFEALLYDTKRYLNLKGRVAGMVPPEVEDWLIARTRDLDTQHLLHVPSTPMGRSAGKWGEWYPDVRQSNGRLGTVTAKPYWPSGWWMQHQRILEALHGQTVRPPLVASGDLHTFAYDQISKSGALDLRDNPVHTAIVGPIGSGKAGLRSKANGNETSSPSQLMLEGGIDPVGRNGFTIVDVTPEHVTLRMYGWDSDDPLDAIDSLEPFFEKKIVRSA